MLIIALVLAVIGLAALVFAVVTSNVLVAWVCIGASVLGVVLLIVDALQERRRREIGAPSRTSGSAEDHELGGGGVSEADHTETDDEADEASEDAEAADEQEHDESVSDEHKAH